MLLHVLPLLVATVFQVQVKAGVERRPMDSTRARAKGDTIRKNERDANFSINIGGGGGDDDEDRPAAKRVPVTDEMRRTAFKDPVARDLLLRSP